MFLSNHTNISHSHLPVLDVSVLANMMFSSKLLVETAVIVPDGDIIRTIAVPCASVHIKHFATGSVIHHHHHAVYYRL